MSSQLRRVHLIATGGTIASKATSKTAVVGYAGYAPSAFSISDLLEAVPGAEQTAQLSAEQMFRKQSVEITDQDMVRIGRRIQEVLDRDEADGVVLVMGTDTIEEVSYFLHLTLKTLCPVVVVGAMRPAGVISSDGPLNLLNAIRVAAAPQSRDQGVLVVMNDHIMCARDVMKASSCKVESFSGGYYGVVGTVRNGVVTFFYRTTRPFGLTSRFSLDLPDVLPRVDNIYLYQGCGADVMKAVLQLEPEALVIGGFGNGALHNDMRDYYREHKGEKLPILVRACRAPYGGSFGDYGHFDEELGCFPAGDMLPSKIRILMKLILTQTHDLEEIKSIFAAY
ncbi:MAG: asparaginase [Ruminococcaceae bacterium]|nr:asparaginase [Oscillospiraceae bacterium]